MFFMSCVSSINLPLTNNSGLCICSLFSVPPTNASIQTTHLLRNSVYSIPYPHSLTPRLPLPCTAFKRSHHPPCTKTHALYQYPIPPTATFLRHSLSPCLRTLPTPLTVRRSLHTNTRICPHVNALSRTSNPTTTPGSRLSVGKRSVLNRPSLITS